MTDQRRIVDAQGRAWQVSILPRVTVASRGDDDSLPEPGAYHVRYVGADATVVDRYTATAEGELTDDRLVQLLERLPESAQEDPNRVELRRVDSSYREFPSAQAWISRTNVDEEHFKAHAARLPGPNTVDTITLRRAQEIVSRAAAIDTGALEGLYDVDQGFTFSIAFQTAAMESAFQAKGTRVRALIESQMAAYQTVLDFATQRQPIVEAWIRNLHAEICAEQQTYLALTELGLQEQRLPKGEYKRFPNHVRTADGAFFAYAPVDLTAHEMHRLIRELGTREFLNAHPIVQASYAHYAFILVHPFADGNGRVARALASVFTYRAHSIPLMILADQRTAYLESLRRADAGDYQAFVDFVRDRAIDSIELAVSSLDAASKAQPEAEVAELRRILTTSGGYNHFDVDSAGYELWDAFRSELRRQTDEAAEIGKLTVKFRDPNDVTSVSDQAHRMPLSKGPRHLEIIIESPAPASAVVTSEFSLEVPRDARGDDEIRIRHLGSNQMLSIKMSDAGPPPKTLTQIRSRLFARQVLGHTLAELGKVARKALSQGGY